MPPEECPLSLSQVQSRTTATVKVNYADADPLFISTDFPLHDVVSSQLEIAKREHIDLQKKKKLVHGIFY